MFKLHFKRLRSISNIGVRDRLCLDLSDSNLKIAHLRIFPGRLEVVNLISKNIIGLNDDGVGKVISKTISELNIKSPEIINVIPPHLVITKNIEIPSINPEEIKDIIELQAGRHTPYSREEIIVGYINIGVYKYHYTKILLAIVARSAIKKQLDILEKIGVRLDRVFFSPEGIAWHIIRNFKSEAEKSPLAVSHIDESFTDFSIIFNEKVIFVRSIPIGTQHLVTDKEKYQARFADEIRRSLEAYHSEDIEKSPNLMVLTGAVGELGYLGTFLEGALNFPIKTMSYLDRKDLSISDKAQQEASAVKYLSFLNVIAPLFAWDELTINLVPEEIKLRKSVEQRGRDLIKTGVWILTIFILVFAILISNIYFKNAYLEKLNKEYASLSKETEEFNKDFDKLSSIKNYLSSRGYALEVLAELYNIIPFDLRLNDIKFDEQGKISLRGIAESMSTVFSFVDSLEKSNYFKDVKTRYTTKRKEGSKDVTDFEINCILESKIYL